MIKACFLVFLFTIANGFYIVKEISPKARSTSGFNLIIAQNDNIHFPDEFQVQISTIVGDYKTFKRIERNEAYPIGGPNIYTIDSGHVVNTNISGANDFEIYKELNGRGFATLIRNEGFVPDQNDNPFRMLGTIYEDDSSVVNDIIPVVEINSKLKRFLSQVKYNSKINTHVLVKRTEKQQNFNDVISDYVENEVQIAQIMRHENNRKKRSNNGVPFRLYVETLVVTDYSIFKNHKVFARTEDATQVMTNMRVYFAHIFNGVAQRYFNSADVDLVIIIKLSNFLFVNTEGESAWTSSTLNGVPGYPTYEGKEVVNSMSVLTSFKNYITSLTASLSYDHAIAFLNKDIWSDSTQLDAATRSLTTGVAYLSGICKSSFKFSIVEERGDFSSVVVAAHEIGHNLGAAHDGQGTSVSCPESDFYIMTPYFGIETNNLLNSLRFSSCSLIAFKNILLTNQYSSVSDQGFCLTNVPNATSSFLAENIFMENESFLKFPGYSWTADDQCKGKYGIESSYPHIQKQLDMCKTFPCRKNILDTGFSFYIGIGAAEGTICDSGKRCFQGICQNSADAPISTCPFGDDIVVSKKTFFTDNPLPSVQMTCEAADNYGLKTLNQFFCANSDFASACCQYCKRYESVTCKDTISNCITFADNCNVIGYTLNKVAIKTVCPRTCQVCNTNAVSCGSTNLCQNGGFCQNANINSNWFGFKCVCPIGYSGFLCETMNKCLINPCLNGSTCVPYGSLGYICQCPIGCSGPNCTNCNGVSETASTSSKTTAFITSLSSTDKNVLFILNYLLKGSTKEYIFQVANDQKLYMDLFDRLTVIDWKKDCRYANIYFTFLEDQLVLNSNIQLVTFQRLSQILPCKNDCNFDRLLSVSSSFNTNQSQLAIFALNTLKLLNPEISCKGSLISKYVSPPQNASALINQINLISLLNPTDFKNFSPTDNINIAKELGNKGLTVSRDMAKNIGNRIPINTNFSDIISITSGVPPEIIFNTDSDVLLQSLSKMDINNMDDFGKNFITYKIIGPRTPNTIFSLLKSTTDSTIINSIPISFLSNIDTTQISARNLPQAFLKKYSREIMASTKLSDIIDMNNLGKILPGITQNDLSNILDISKINVLVNMFKASKANNIDLTSYQRTFMRNSLINSLAKLSRSSNPSVYLKTLSVDQLNSLYPLFIEAPESLLKEFSQLNLFQTVVTNVFHNIDETQCCEFARANRKLFVKYALPFVSNNNVLTFSDLLTLGKCFGTVLPLDTFKAINEADFLSFYANVDKTFQPDSSETEVVASKIKLLASLQTSQETFVLKLNNLAMYYSSFALLNVTSFRNTGATIIDLILKARDTANSEIQKCRFGVDNDANTQIIQTTIQNVFVTDYLQTVNNARQLTGSTKLTCDDLNNLSNSLNSIQPSLLEKISTSDFVNCQQLLGRSNNDWSSSQLAVLVAKAKQIYPDFSKISDADIAELNAICLGLDNIDLANLRFKAMSSTRALGALSSWTSSQLSVGLKTGTEAYVNSNGAILTSDMVNSMSNLACSLSTNVVNTMTTGFNASVSSLSKISSICPNIESWYTLAEKNYYKTISASSFSELGSLIAGIPKPKIHLIPQEIMSSIGPYVWNIMSVDKVNSFSLTQLQGLTTAQVVRIFNSPNYSLFSSTIKKYVNSVANGVPLDSPVTNGSVLIKFCLTNIVFSLISAFLLRSLL